MSFTEKILKVMKERNISAYQLEEETQLAHSTISSWKRGTVPTIDKAIKVIKYLDLSADELFELNNNEKIMPAEKSQFIRIGKTHLKHVKNVISLINDECSKKEIMKYLEGLELYADREIEKYNEWDKHTLE